MRNEKTEVGRDVDGRGKMGTYSDGGAILDCEGPADGEWEEHGPDGGLQAEERAF